MEELIASIPPYLLETPTPPYDFDSDISDDYVMGPPDLYGEVKPPLELPNASGAPSLTENSNYHDGDSDASWYQQQHENPSNTEYVHDPEVPLLNSGATDWQNSHYYRGLGNQCDEWGIHNTENVVPQMYLQEVRDATLRQFEVSVAQALPDGSGFDFNAPEPAGTRVETWSYMGQTFSSNSSFGLHVSEVSSSTRVEITDRFQSAQTLPISPYFSANTVIEQSGYITPPGQLYPPTAGVVFVLVPVTNVF